MVLNRPDKFHSNRSSGFRDSATNFDGKTLTFLGKNTNLHTQVEIAGTVDNLIDTMIEKLDRTPPAADLLSASAYDQLMNGVIDVNPNTHHKANWEISKGAKSLHLDAVRALRGLFAEQSIDEAKHIKRAQV